MDKSRLEIKVGLFVSIGLVLIVTSMVWFSQGASLFRSTYVLKLHTANVGGLKPEAGVLLAGVNVGTVQDIRIDPSGTNVTVLLHIYKDRPIYHDAVFNIESSGFLGDQYVAVVPTTNSLPVLTNGADVQCKAPFDLQEAARSAKGVLDELKATLSKVNSSVDALQTKVLNADTLGKLMSDVHDVTERAKGTLNDLDGLIATNHGQVNTAVSNVVQFSVQLTQFGNSASSLLAASSNNISDSLSNIHDLTVQARQLFQDVQSGKGVAGELLESGQAATNVLLLTENLAITTSNLNRLGLWHLLWSHPPPDTNTVKPVTLQSPPRRQ